MCADDARNAEARPHSACAHYELGPFELIHLPAVRPGAFSLVERISQAGLRSYAFLLLIDGTARLGHYGLRSTLLAGDFVLMNSAAPVELDLLTDAKMVLLRVAPEELRGYLPSCEHLCGRPLRACEGISRGTAELTQCILGLLEGGVETHFRSRIARNLLDALATAFAIVLDRQFNGSPIICARNARVRLYIERNLRDPELKPATIAANLRISSRYLRAIFVAGKETVSAYILRRRLEECARDLADPARSELSITEIAFSWGFNSGPHFTRSFRHRYFISPREHRGRLALQRDFMSQSQESCREAAPTQLYWDDLGCQS